MTVILGIDPGFSGAVVFHDPRENLLAIRDMPVAPSPEGRVELDYLALYDLLNQEWEPGTRKVVMLEKVAARPNQGAAATFRFGEGYGALRMALIATGWELHRVTPTVWKKAMGLSKDKGVSRALARERFPAYAQFFARVKDDGRAEAAILTLYAKDKLRL